jgi:D-serine deaminase-like pyridoxal phosphate-dependent protein
VTRATADRLPDEPVDWRFKGFPVSAGVTVGTVGARGWRALDGDLGLPIAVLKRDALEHNIRRMADYCRESGVDLAPHAKTTMAPALVARQLEAGAWGVTVATVSQARVFRQFGVSRLIIAGQVVQDWDVRWIADEGDRDPSFECFALVDSVAGVRQLQASLIACGARRRLPVLLELGYAGGRAGCRDVEEALSVAAAISEADRVELAGVEAFEGLMPGSSPDGVRAAVDELMARIRETVLRISASGGFAGRAEIILTAGGSSYFDRVVAGLCGGWSGDMRLRIVLRSGCYLTHDSGLYEATSALSAANTATDPLRPALEVWGAVVSRPEAQLAIVGFGRRDVSYDAGMPVPLLIRSGEAVREATGMTVTALNDQHAYLSLPAGDELAVGDLLGCGISHPCSTFDKWQLIPVVDGDYTVVDAVRTYF